MTHYWVFEPNFHFRPSDKLVIAAAADIAVKRNSLNQKAVQRNLTIVRSSCRNSSRHRSCGIRNSGSACEMWGRLTETEETEDTEAAWMKYVRIRRNMSRRNRGELYYIIANWVLYKLARRGHSFPSESLNELLCEGLKWKELQQYEAIKQDWDSWKIHQLIRKITNLYILRWRYHFRANLIIKRIAVNEPTVVVACPSDTVFHTAAIVALPLSITAGASTANPGTDYQFRPITTHKFPN